MKVRRGFVSNSSSTSFCIYGVSFDRSEILDMLVEEGQDKEKVDVYDLIEKKVQEYGNLTLHSGPYGDAYYIGRDFSDIGDDETGRQFKDSVEKSIESIFGKKIQCFICEESWYDG